MGIARVKRRLRLAKKSSGWWIVDAPAYYVDGKGPYTSYGPYTGQNGYKEAGTDRDGLERTLEEIGYEDEEPPKNNPKPTKKKAPKVKAIEQEGFW